MAFVYVDRTIDAVVEETIVKSGIPCLRCLPFDVAVVAVRTISVIPLVTEQIAGFWIRGREGCHVWIVVENVLLTSLAIAKAQFQVCQNLVLFQERLLGNLPSQGYRREITIAVALGKSRRSVGTQSCRNHVFVVVAIVQSSI